ncbi:MULTISPECIES: helix-turn-helix domain-containing protein [Paenibacillus]|uniref:helix-turn-helix domain-containing protein n=1 Tax=Paenibacillus TaxID=44249 RepID=UPI0009D75AB2|nr:MULTISPECIES: helix-turn-helix domain-containing protein [Paenibacillus]MDH6429868.1 two-component system response regulator YesN [Paenibacillus sp. PastH-4]MDH6446032.1 two-component system response regulator YesN [Paenibacillus sp. PastF-4]MDH6530499.1 two-component system response regulator YesN [Paenibacillus sp. PastH-3]
MSYLTSISVTQSISIENGVTQLQKSQEILERRMAEVEGFTRQLAVNQELNVLMNESENETNVYGIWKTMRNVLTFGQTNDFLQNYYIYLANYNLILTPGSTYRPEHYYSNFNYKDLSLQDWRKEVLETTHRSEIKPLSDFVSRGMQTSVITYMQSLPLDSFNDSSPAVAVVIIDEKNISSLLSGLTERYGGWVHISDAKGNTIVLQGSDEQKMVKMLDDPAFDKNKVSQFYKDDLVITTRSDSNGWVYQTGIPQDILMENANKIKRISIQITGGTLIIGLIAGLILAYRNSAPINRMLSVMKEQFGKEEASERNEFDFLSGNIADMITKNKLLESELNRQLPLVRDAFLKRLIAGEFKTRDEIISAAKQADISMNQNTGYVGIVQINGYAGMDSVEILNELSASRLLLKQTLADLGVDVLMTDMGSDKVVTLFFSREEGADKEQEAANITQTMEELAINVFNEYRITILAGFGDLFTEVTEVSLSYDQSKQALEYAVYMNKKGIIWSSEAQIENTTYYYPLDSEQRLISTIRAGELEEAKRIVRAIIVQNMEQRELSIEMKHQLVGEMKGTFLKLLDQKAFTEYSDIESVKRRVIDIGSSESLETIQNEFFDIMEELCGLIANKKKDIHIQIIKQIKDYTAKNYSDTELTLYRVAEQVERPEKYISQLFKEVTGVNFSDHLIKVRMDQAIILLKESGLTVDEIAVRVGYNSSHSFRRAFKRLMGVSPSAYRQSVDE